MTDKHVNEVPRDEHAVIAGVSGKKVFVMDNAGNQITSFGGGTGNATITLDNSKAFIGIVTVANPTSFTGNVTLDPGSLTGIRGNLTLSDPKGFIGLVTIGNQPNVAIVGNVTLSDSKGFIGLVTTTISSIPTVSVQFLPFSFYQQNSLVSGYVYYGSSAPGSNPTQSVFRIQREALDFGDILFGGGAPTFVHQWSSASLASLTYL